MNRLTLYFVLLAAAICVRVTAQGKPLSTPEEGVAKSKSGLGAQKSATSDQGKDYAHNMTVIVNQENSASEKSHANKAQEEDDRKTQKYLVIFTGLLVVAGFITCGILIWQSCETRRSVSATKKAAEAARLNAQAVIDAERARVIAELTPLAAHYESPVGWCSFIDGRPVRMNQEAVNRGEHLLHSLKFINMGRTVAHISAYQIHYGFFNWRTETLNIEEIRHNDDFDHMIEGSNGFVVNEVIDIYKFVSDPSAEVSTFKTWMVVLVSVSYTHVFSDEPEQNVFRFVYGPKSMTLRRAQATEADRVQCHNRTILPLSRTTPNVSRTSEGNEAEQGKDSSQPPQNDKGS